MCRTAVSDIGQFPEFPVKATTFVWDSGSEPGVADPEDFFVDWSIDCDPGSSILSYQEAYAARAAVDKGEVRHVRRVLRAFALSANDFTGSIVRGRLGSEGKPLFLLFPSTHSLSFLDASRSAASRDRSAALHASNALDFLKIIEIATERGQSVTNATVMTNMLLGSALLRNAREEITHRMSRDTFPTDRAWVEAILDEGAIDASVILLFAMEDNEWLNHSSLEAAYSFIRSAILIIVLDMRNRSRVRSEKTLYNSFANEYIMGLTYNGMIQHRFPSNSALQQQFSDHWNLFRDYSLLTEPLLHAEVINVCEWRNRNMVNQLEELVRTERSNYYLVTFGPLHIHGVLQGLELSNFSYLLIAP